MWELVRVTPMVPDLTVSRHETEGEAIAAGTETLEPVGTFLVIKHDGTVTWTNEGGDFEMVVVSA